MDNKMSKKSSTIQPKRRILTVNSYREMVKAKCAFLRMLVWNESVKDKILYDIVLRNRNGIIEDVAGISYELRHKYGLSVAMYSKYINQYIKEGYFSKEGYCYIVHPLLSNKGDMELLLNINYGIAKE